MAMCGVMRRLNSQEYKNWIKAGQCLLMLQSRLHDYIECEMRSFHRHLAGTVTATHTHRCRCRAKGKQFQPNCPVCAEWKEMILAHHNNRSGEIHWGNCDPSRWPTHYWEVAKVYMPRGYTQEARKCDAAAFLNLINSCDHFKVSNISRVREVIKCRNDLMHKSDFMVSSSWLVNFRQKMLDFISEFTQVPGLQQERQKMEEVLSSNFDLIFQDNTYEVDGPGVAYAMDEPPLPLLLLNVEIQLIQQMLVELYMQIEERGTFSEDDQDNINKVKHFLSENEDLKSYVQEDLDRLDLLQSNITSV